MWQNKIIHRKKKKDFVYSEEQEKKKRRNYLNAVWPIKWARLCGFLSCCHTFLDPSCISFFQAFPKNKWLATSMWQIKFYRQSTAVQILSFNGFRPFYIHFICELSRKLLDSGTLSADLGHLGITGYKTYPCAHFSLSLTTADIHLASLSFGYHHIPCCALSAHCSFCFM